ncbi:MAG TPA: hypothetical protein VLX68_13460 [Chitinivibrionales bacterium]|nr:hypothetical protein [Chitinivibrionales bacterium]
MIGKWTGSYRYSGWLMRKLIPYIETRFEINISEFDGHTFKGTVQDDLSTGGTPGIGSIDGIISEYKIEFIKKMPIRASYLTSGKHLIEQGKKHPPIYYSGVFGPDLTEAGGKWRIKTGFALVGFLPALRLPLRGEWTMAFQRQF